jgi:hypothetical protein
MQLFLKKYGIRLFGISLALFLYLRLDVSSIGNQLGKTDPFYFLLAVACVNAVVVLQAWRGYILLGEEKAKLRFSAYTHSYFVSMAASAALPGRIGAVAQVPLLHQRGVGVGVGFANVLYDKLCDLAGFLTMSALFSIVLASGDLAINPGLLFCLSVSILVLFWYVDVFFVFAYALMRRLLPNFTRGWSSFELALSPQVKLYALFLTFVRLIGAVAVHWFCSRAVGLNISLFMVGAAASFGALTTLIPISVMGVGLRESIFLLLLSGAGFADEQILSFAFLLLLTYLSTVFIGTFLTGLK